MLLNTPLARLQRTEWRTNRNRRCGEARWARAAGTSKCGMRELTSCICFNFNRIECQPLVYMIYDSSWILDKWNVDVYCVRHGTEAIECTVPWVHTTQANGSAGCEQSIGSGLSLIVRSLCAYPSHSPRTKWKLGHHCFSIRVHVHLYYSGVSYSLQLIFYILI